MQPNEADLELLPQLPEPLHPPQCVERMVPDPREEPTSLQTFPR